MRLDHLLSKEEEVEIVLLFRYQASNFVAEKEKMWKLAFRHFRKRGNKLEPNSSEDERSEFELVWNESCEMKYQDTSGGDASGGHTRSHPEHEG